MIGEYVRSLEGIATLGVIGLVASLVLFVVLVARVVRTPAREYGAHARLPLDDASAPPSSEEEALS